MTEPLRLTRDGLRLLLESDGEPYRRRELGPELAEQYDRLVAAGLLDDRGRVERDARHAVETLRRPDVRMEIEAVVGRTGRRWYAAMGETHAVVLSPPGIAIGPGVDAETVASFDEPPPAEFDVQIVPKSWAPVAACEWVGIGPRRQRSGLREAPGPIDPAALRRRLADASEPVPPGAGAELWEQPLLMWGVRTEPGDAHALVLDGGVTGLWAVVEVESAVRLLPLPPYEAWCMLLTAITQAYRSG